MEELQTGRLGRETVAVLKERLKLRNSLPSQWKRSHLSGVRKTAHETSQKQRCNWVKARVLFLSGLRKIPPLRTGVGGKDLLYRKREKRREPKKSILRRASWPEKDLLDYRFGKEKEERNLRPRSGGRTASEVRWSLTSKKQAGPRNSRGSGKSSRASRGPELEKTSWEKGKEPSHSLLGFSEITAGGNLS